MGHRGDHQEIVVGVTVKLFLNVVLLGNDVINARIRAGNIPVITVDVFGIFFLLLLPIQDVCEEPDVSEISWINYT